MSKRKKKKSKFQTKQKHSLDGKIPSKITENIPKMHLLIPDNKKSVKSDTSIKFVNVSIETKDLINLGIDVWRMEQRLNKVLNSLPENSQELLKNSIQKIKRYLDKNSMQIVDHTNQKYNDGKNIEVLAVEKSPDISESIIKETKEPTILHKNLVVNKGKVIILEKNDEVTTND